MMTTNSNGHIDVDEKLAAIQWNDLRGWKMTPTRGKRPYRTGWQTERLGCDMMTDIIGDTPATNIGVLLGEPSR